MSRATTIRLTDEVFARLDQASSRTGMPVNSIVIAASLEWMQRHFPEPFGPDALAVPTPGPPRWATIRRAMAEVVAGRVSSPIYPFERFTSTAQAMLVAAHTEAQKSGYTYIGTEHLLLAAFADSTSHAAVTLGSIGFREEAARATIDKLIRGKKGRPNPRIVPTSRVKRVIELAFKLCGTRGDPLVSTGHVLLALATEGESIAGHILKDAGATPERIGIAMETLTEPEA